MVSQGGRGEGGRKGGREGREKSREGLHICTCTLAWGQQDTLQSFSLVPRLPSFVRRPKKAGRPGNEASNPSLFPNSADVQHAYNYITYGGSQSPL